MVLSYEYLYFIVRACFCSIVGLSNTRSTKGSFRFKLRNNSNLYRQYELVDATVCRVHSPGDFVTNTKKTRTDRSFFYDHYYFHSLLQLCAFLLLYYVYVFLMRVNDVI